MSNAQRMSSTDLSSAARARVWVVDDSPLESQRVCSLLSQQYEVDAFSEGASMLERLSAGVAPDLVLLDWQMPGVSGVEACRFLRERYDEVSLPILMLTSRGARQDFAEGLMAGANDYVAKPYDDAELLARVRTLVRTRRLAEAIRVREERFVTTLTSIGDAVITTDLKGVITFLNHGAEVLTGWQSAEVLGRLFDDVFEVFDAGSHTRVESAVRGVLREHQTVGLSGDQVLRRRDGSEVPVEQTATPIGEGSALGVVVVLRDISLRRRAALEAKERADFEEKLIGIVSHDLRNPLNVILLSATSLLRYDQPDERTSKISNRIVTSAERATRLVTDLLDFTQARLGSGIPVYVQPVDLNAIAGQVVEELHAAHPAREVRVEHVGDTTGEWDPDRLAQVLLNLLSNAVKYGLDDGEVVLRTKGEADAVVVEVHNRGTPIPPELLPVVFQPMRRGATRRSDRSVGLGLYIVKHIVDAHGGGIEARSSADEGTTFTVRLPRKRREAQPAPVKEKAKVG